MLEEPTDKARNNDPREPQSLSTLLKMNRTDLTWVNWNWFDVGRNMPQFLCWLFSSCYLSPARFS